MNKLKLSVVLATRNEEKNISKCLESIKDIADEIIVFDEYSTDRTVEMARKYGAKVYLEPHHDNFHITKQKALEKAKGDWILQLDADEVVTPELAKEILEVANGTHISKVNNLFKRHQRLIEERDGKIGESTGEIAGYFIPRKNIFLGKPLIHSGVYPDGVIRLVKKGKAYFPQKSVHEQIILEGEVSWLSGDILHYDSPTFERYLERLNRYTDLKIGEFEQKKLSRNVITLLFYSFVKPAIIFLKLYIRHKGFIDGMRGFVWSLFSALHFPIAYFKYWLEKEKNK